MIKVADKRKGEIIRVVNPVQNFEVDAEIVSPHFYDPKGERQRG